MHKSSKCDIIKYVTPCLYPQYLQKNLKTPSQNLFKKCFTNTRKPPLKLPKISLNLPKPHPLHSSDINPEIYLKNITQSPQNKQAKLLAKVPKTRCSQF